MPKTSKPTTNAKPAECRVEDCLREPTTRGLCDSHWASRRGLAEPKEVDRGAADADVYARP